MPVTATASRSSAPCATLTAHLHLLPAAAERWIRPADRCQRPRTRRSRSSTPRLGRVAGRDRTAAGARRRRRPEDHTGLRPCWKRHRLRRRFDVIVVAYFFERAAARHSPRRCARRPAVLRDLHAALVPTARRTPDWKLADNELPSAPAGLRLRYYRDEQDAGDPALGLRGIAGYIGQRPA